MSRPLSTRLVAGPTRLVVDQAEVRVVAGPDKGARLELGLATLVIGSGADCDLVLHDPTVSARHAELGLGERGYEVRDLASKNGVVVGDVAVLRAQVSDGMKLRLGDSTLKITAAGEVSHEIGEVRRFGPLVAHSLKMRAAVAQLERYAAAEISILVEGETGTGKELAALAVHQASRRAQGPFVVFDGGAVADSLVASALFGHERGAFTGADELQVGVFEEADGGTLFLDEIGELSLEVQPMLLRALESGTTRRIGGQPRHHDVRVVAATNRNLAEEVRAGRFRQDLFYRLAGARVRLPPLRERREDLPVLARQFADETGARLGPELLALLAGHDWPGNVRELRHTLARAALSDDPGFAVAAAAPIAPLPEARRAAADEFERDYVGRALARAGGSVSRAAELAGVSRQMLTRLITKHGLRGAD